MMNPYLIAGLAGVGFFGAKKFYEKVQNFRKPKLNGTFTVAEFRKKSNGLREQYADNKEVIALLDSIDDLCKNLNDDDELTIGNPYGKRVY